MNRFCPAGVPTHTYQRGVNRQAIFLSDEDKRYYLRLWSRYASEEGVRVHSWVLMTNHVHFLVTPETNQGVSSLFQAVGRSYVQYFNKCHGRTGTLFEGRFKNSVIDSNAYFLICQRYVELNPIRAGMVSSPGAYAWSSYAAHAYGADQQLLTVHPSYQSLASNSAERQRAYQKFCGNADAHEDEAIRYCLRKGYALGDEQFVEALEVSASRSLRPVRLGRPNS